MIKAKTPLSCSAGTVCEEQPLNATGFPKAHFLISFGVNILMFLPEEQKNNRRTGCKPTLLLFILFLT